MTIQPTLCRNSCGRRPSRRLSARKCKGTSDWSEPGTLDTNLQRHFKPSETPTRIYKTSSWTPRPYSTEHGRRPCADQNRPCSRKEKTLNRHLGRSERPSAPMPEHWKARADSNRPYSGLFKRSEPNIKASSARTETGTEWSQEDP